jgi:hypothetical protein
MRRRRPIVLGVVPLAIILTTALSGGAAELTLAGPDGGAVRWSEWLQANGPAAVVVWASWAPGADEVADELDQMGVAARSQQLTLVVVGVQESAEEAARVLGRSGAPWLHDRHGAILKEYRLIRVPILVVVDRQGEVLARLEPSAEALRAWQR